MTEHEAVSSTEAHEIDHDESIQPRFLSLSQLGYLIILSVWFLFLITVNSLFEIWRLVIFPFSQSPTTLQLHEQFVVIFSTVDYYVLSLWCLYVVFWWWALLSWIGLKLFRQSKGLQT